jgi:hypothetical protein
VTIDETAAAASEEAGGLIESFAATLEAERRSRLMAAPPINEILSHAGRTPAA